MNSIGTFSCCLSYAGDRYDLEIMTLIGHHPRCPKRTLMFKNPEQKKRFVEALRAMQVNQKNIDLFIRCFEEN